MADYDYIQELRRDLPQEFKSRPRIDALIRAFGRQLNELLLFFQELNLGRYITTAEGSQLDTIGNILVLSRRDAQEILGDVSGELDDESYRKLLVYKAQKNFGDGTYRSIMDCLKIIHDDIESFRYVEELEHPATLILETDKSPFSKSVSDILKTPIPRSGGVGLLIRATEDEKFGYGTGIVPITSYRIKADSNDVNLEDAIYLADELENILVDSEGGFLLADETDLVSIFG